MRLGIRLFSLIAVLGPVTALSLVQCAQPKPASTTPPSVNPAAPAMPSPQQESKVSPEKKVSPENDRGRAHRQQDAAEIERAPKEDVVFRKFLPHPLSEAQRRDAEALAKQCETTVAEKDCAKACFRSARIYFDAQHWQEAAAGFRHVAFQYPTTEDGEAGARLYLECLNILITRGAEATLQKSSQKDMTEDVPRLQVLYCQKSKSAEACELLTKISVDISRLHAMRSLEQGIETKNRELVLASGAEFDDLYAKRCASYDPRFACDEFASAAVQAYFIANRIDLARSIATRVLSANRRHTYSALQYCIACLLEGTNTASVELYLRSLRKIPKLGPCPPWVDQTKAVTVSFASGGN